MASSQIKWQINQNSIGFFFIIGRREPKIKKRIFQASYLNLIAATKKNQLKKILKKRIDFFKYMWSQKAIFSFEF